MVRCAIGRAAQDEYLLAMSDTFDSRGIRAIHPSEILRVEPETWVAWWSVFGQWCKISVGCVQSSCPVHLKYGVEPKYKGKGRRVNMPADQSGKLPRSAELFLVSSSYTAAAQR